MDTILAVLCSCVALAGFVGLLIWVIDIVGAPARAWRRHEELQQQMVDLQQEMVDSHQEEAEQRELDAETSARAEAIIARAAGRPPDSDDLRPPRPLLRLIPSGPDAVPPPDLQVAAEPPAPPADGGPPLAPGDRMVNLGPPDGPTLTVWQRNLIRSLLGRRHSKVPGLNLSTLTVSQAERLVAELGGNPRKLYTGGRAWGQKRR